MQTHFRYYFGVKVSIYEDEDELKLLYSDRKSVLKTHKERLEKRQI